MNTTFTGQTEPPERGERAPGRRRRLLRRGVRAIAVLALLFAVLWAVGALVTGRMLERKLAALRAAGEPVAMRDLAPTVPPGAENAADLYEDAFDALRLTDEDERKLFHGGAAGEADRLATARRVIAQNEEYFALLERASNRTHCAFWGNWEAGIRMTFPHLGPLRQAARLLSLRADLLLGQGRDDEALRCHAASLRMGRHARTTPTLLAYVFANAIQDTAIEGLRRVLSEGDPTAAACRATFHELEAADRESGLAVALQGERTFGIWLFDDFRSTPASEVAAMIWMPTSASPVTMRARAAAVKLYRTVGRPLLNLDQIAYLRAWEQQLDALHLPPAEAEEVREDLRAEIERMPVYRHPITKAIFPIFGGAVLSEMAQLARLHSAQIALAVAGHRAETGAYPESLSEIEAVEWAFPADPFGGGPYRYRREGEGFRVWSLGPDLDDDGGRPLNEQALRRLRGKERDRAYRDYDVVFACARHDAP